MVTANFGTVRKHLGRAGAIAVMMIASMGSDCGGSDVVDPVLPVGFTMSSGQSIVVPQGGSAKLTVSIARQGGFTGQVDVGGQPAVGTSETEGVLISTESIAPGATTATLTITATSTAAVRNHAMALGAIAVGYQTQSALLTVSVSAPSSFSIMSPDPLRKVTLNSTLRVHLQIVRDSYTQPVTFSSSNLYGVTGVTISPVTTSGDSVDVSFPLTSVPTFQGNPNYGQTTIDIVGTGADGKRVPYTLRFTFVELGLNVKTSPLNLVAGGASKEDTVFIIRKGFATGDVISVSGASDAGLTITPKASPTADSLTVLTVSAAASVSAGTHPALLTATNDNIVATRTFSIEVGSAPPPAPTISVSPGSTQLQIGQQLPVTAVVTNAAGTGQVQWTSADPTVVSVSPANVAASSAGSQTTFTGLKAGGPVDVTASYTANGVTVTGKVAVTVAAPASNAVVAMYLDPVSSEYTPSAGNFYRARLINSQGGEVSATSDGGVITYASSDTAVINIDPANGLASIVKKAVTSVRTANITAIYKKAGQTIATAAPSAVVVYPTGGADMGAVQFSIAGSASRIAIGQTIQFQIIVRDQNGIQQTSRAVRDQLVVTSLNTTALGVAPVGPDSYFFNMTAKALPASSALAGIPNVVTIKADINGAMTTIPIIITP